MDIIEKVARAICRAHYLKIYLLGEDLVDRWVEAQWETFKPEARAALLAIREPTEEDLEAILIDTRGRLDCTCSECVGRALDGARVVEMTIKALVDTALKTSTEKAND